MSKGCPETIPKPCSVITCPKVYYGIICDWVFHQMLFQEIAIHVGPSHMIKYSKSTCVAEIVFPQPIIEDETWQLISKMLDCEKIVQRIQSCTRESYANDKHQIFKGTLVSRLNANLVLFKLMWVKNPICANNNKDILDLEKHLKGPFYLLIKCQLFKKFK